MTRHIILIASLFTATTAFATPSAPSLAESLSIAADTPTSLETEAFIKADMSFADAMRMISTLTLPEMNTQVAISSGPTIRVRQVVPSWRAGKVSSPATTYSVQN